MAVRLQDAIEFAWAALLEEVGEPFVPDWRAYGFSGGEVRGRGWAGYADQWWVSFIDLKAWGPCSSVAHAWVDRMTGDTRVWVNEDYDPAFDPFASTDGR
jgi:hypothetical protein